MIGVVPKGQKAAVDLGMEGLEPAIHHFREPGVIRYVSHLDASLPKGGGRAACGQDLHSVSFQPFGEVDDACLVRDADERPLNFVQSHGCLLTFF